MTLRSDARLLIVLALLVLPLTFGPVNAESSPRRLHEGDTFVYSYASHSKDLDLHWQGHLTLTYLGPSHAIDAFADLTSCLLWAIEANLTIVEADFQKTTHKTVCHETEDPRRSMSSTMGSSLGVPHTWNAFGGTFASATSARYDMARLPPAETLRDAPGTMEWETPARTSVYLQWSLDGDRLDLRGEETARWDPSLSIQWSAIYGPSAPLPSEITIWGDDASANWFETSLKEDFSTRLELVQYEWGQDDSFGGMDWQEAPEPTPDAGAENWLQVFDLTGQHLHYPVREAWEHVLEATPDVAAAVRDQGSVFPYEVTYRIYNESEVRFSYEWNITFCGGSGSCVSAVSGTSRTLGGIEEQYSRYGEGHRASGGSFQGATFPHSEQKEVLAALGVGEGIEQCIHGHQALNPDLPVRELQLLAHSKDGRPVNMLPGLEVNHGRANREPYLLTPGYDHSASLVINSCDPATGGYQLLQELQGRAPGEWTREGPIL